MEKGSGRRSTYLGRERSVFSQNYIGTRVENVRTLPSITIHLELKLKEKHNYCISEAKYFLLSSNQVVHTFGLLILVKCSELSTGCGIVKFCNNMNTFDRGRGGGGRDLP